MITVLQIKVDDVDELFRLSIELQVLTYLYELVQCDKQEDVVADEDFAFARRNAMAYLNEYQLDAVLRLHALLEKEDFVFPVIDTKKAPSDEGAVER